MPASTKIDSKKRKMAQKERNQAADKLLGSIKVAIPQRSLSKKRKVESENEGESGTYIFYIVYLRIYSLTVSYRGS